MRIQRIVIVSGLLMLTAGYLQADTVISWGQADDIVTTTANLGFDDNTAVVFDSGYMSPAQGESYYPNDTGKTPNFYGAAYRMYDDGAGGGPVQTTSNCRIINSTPDYLYNSYNGGETTALNNYYYTYLWKADDFLGNTGGETFALTGMQINVTDNGSGVNTNAFFVVQLSDANWYITDAFGEGDVSFTDPTSIAWYSYDPTVNISAIGGAASLTASDFENLTAAGYYVEALSTGRYVQSRVYGMNVYADIVPEPATMGLMALGALGMLRRRRK